MDKIKIGHLYRNEWGTLRTPILIAEKDVIFIEKHEDSQFFLYNPYRGMVSITQFIKTYSIQDISNPLTNKEVEKIYLTILTADEDWSALLIKAGQQINKILHEKTRT